MKHTELSATYNQHAVLASLQWPPTAASIFKFVSAATAK